MANFTDLIVVKNVVGGEVKISPRFPSDTTNAWECKDITNDCEKCPSCVGKEKVKDIIEIVDENKGRREWFPPEEEHILGLCTWGVLTKILVRPRTKIRKCRYFLKPRVETRQISY